MRQFIAVLNIHRHNINDYSIGYKTRPLMNLHISARHEAAAHTVAQTYIENLVKAFSKRGRNFAHNQYGYYKGMYDYELYVMDMIRVVKKQVRVI